MDKIGYERLLLQDHVYNIMNWSTERGIDKCSSKKQLYKIVEEVGELTSAYLKNDLDKFMDAIGDVFIASTIFCQQESLKVMEFYYPAEYCADFNQALNRLILSTADMFTYNWHIKSITNILGSLSDCAHLRNVSMVCCVEKSWNEIKDRKGKIIDDMWVKEEDLG